MSELIGVEALLLRAERRAHPVRPGEYLPARGAPAGELPRERARIEPPAEGDNATPPRTRAPSSPRLRSAEEEPSEERASSDRSSNAKLTEASERLGTTGKWELMPTHMAELSREVVSLICAHPCRPAAAW